jgi:oligopeptide transport system substrate-binding protein
MFRSKFFLLVVSLAAIVLAACSAPVTSVPAVSTNPAPTSAPVAAPKVLRIGASIYPDILDPQKSSHFAEIAVLRLTYEGLLTIDEKGTIGPGGADKWESSKDGTQMTFHIRAGLKRFDGTPITAQDYEYALRREVDPRIPGKNYTSIVYDIQGATELNGVNAQTATPNQIDKAFANYGVKAIDANTLVVTFTKPIGWWQYVAYTWVTFPSDKQQVDKAPDTWWTKPEGHNGNGPFKIKSIEPNQKIVLVANENYWRGKPALDRIELIYSADTSVILEAYKKNEVDMTSEVNADDVSAINADATLKRDFLRYPSAATLGLAFNLTRKPFDDKNVRMAFSQAFDRGGYINTVNKGVGKPYTRWIPPGVPGAQPEKAGVPNTDFAAAAKTLVNNGYAASGSTADKPKVDCAKLGALKLTYIANPRNQATYQFIAGNLVNAFNCPIALEPVDRAVLAEMTKDVKTTPQMFAAGWVQDYPHPQNWLSVYWVCGGFSKRYGYCNKDFDALIQQADQELDLQKSIDLYRQAEDLLVQDVPMAFIYCSESLFLAKPWVIGPKDHTGSNDSFFAGITGPVWTYTIDLSQVPPNYPKQ